MAVAWSASGHRTHRSHAPLLVSAYCNDSVDAMRRVRRMSSMTPKRIPNFASRGARMIRMWHSDSHSRSQLHGTVCQYHIKRPGSQAIGEGDAVTQAGSRQQTVGHWLGMDDRTRHRIGLTFFARLRRMLELVLERGATLTLLQESCTRVHFNAFRAKAPNFNTAPTTLAPIWDDA